MQNNLINPQQALNKVFYNTKIIRAEMDNFKIQMIAILDAIDIKETEEFHKNLVISFLKKTFYDPNYFVNTKGRNDLVIHNGKDAKSAVGVIIEAKSPVNKSEMITVNDLNGKALQELVLYYLRERITHKNTNLKQLVVTNIYEWFVFDAHVFNKLFAENKKLVKDFIDFEEKRTSGKTTDYFYKEIAKPIIESIKNDIVFTHFNINQYNEPLRNNDPEDDKLLVALFKLISPEHLLKLPFANDNNTLDRGFYEELLHIIGLTEIKDGGKKIIVRHEPKNRNAGSLIENAIVQLESLDKISRINNPKNYGDTQDEILFGVALELCITWINRILFLKLLEAQIITYHKNETGYSFLNADLIKDYDKLNTLFFQVLAKKPLERNASVAGVFSKVPYLNSSLFEPTELEHETLFISGLEDDTVLKLLPNTVIKNNLIKKTGNLNALEYLFSFLDAYDFATDVNEKFKSSDKKLINAAVLGLIFEKINGYKDGSFFTPSFITMYMCKETIRRAVVQKFNEIKGWNCTDFEQLYNKIEDIKEANAIVNKLKICDPAVGSGHFLVSALNEIIVIKHELRILQDKKGNRLKDYHFEIINDELIITDEDGLVYLYNPKFRQNQRIQETLFHEKRSIIESCLFGVDINPNSVKICQLRLWIELLKNAYYHFGTTDLETFPNIDINIKCGNSLISRFALDADLKKALKDSKWTIDSYKLAVSTYQNATDKAQKREMQALINDVISNFTTEIATNDPKKLKLEKAKGDFFNKTNQTGMFELGKKEQEIWNKQINVLAAEIKILETDIEDLKKNRIYDRAFEWRFEFPQVLNDDGDFMGFDVIIGNPPYITVKDMNTDVRDYLFRVNTEYSSATFKTDLYAFFIEKALKLVTKKGFVTKITPYSWFTSSSFESLRRVIFKENFINKLVVFPNGIFDEANIATSIICLDYIKNESIKLKDFRNSKIDDIKKIINNLEYNDLSIDIILQQEKLEIPIDVSVDDFGIITNINLIKTKLQDFYLIDLGMNTADDDKYIFNTNNGLTNPKKLIEGKDFSSYKVNWGGKYIDYLPDEFKKKDTARPGNEERFEVEKIILYRFIGSNGLFKSIFDEDNFFSLGSTYVLRKSNLDYSLKFLISILNSKFVGYFYTKQFSGSKITKNELYKLPIPEISETDQQPFIKIVDKILSLKKTNPQADTLALEAEIDAMVYQLYGLTDEEIKIVEGK